MNRAPLACAIWIRLAFYLLLDHLLRKRNVLRRYARSMPLGPLVQPSAMVLVNHWENLGRKRFQGLAFCYTVSAGHPEAE
jgi:hypothetical protein